MAAIDPVSRFAWALEIDPSGPTVYRFATRDFPEDAHVTALGGFFEGRIRQPYPTVSRRFGQYLAGVDVPDNFAVVLDNSDLTLSSATDWRGTAVKLYHYDATNLTKTTDFSGIILEAEFVTGLVRLTCGTHDDALFGMLLPAYVIDPVSGGQFETAGDANVPIPVPVGTGAYIRPPDISRDTSSDPGGYDFAAGFGELAVLSVFWDSDRDMPGLERADLWETGPGSPAYASTTTFTVTGDQSKRYERWWPLRFKTTASAGDYVYTRIGTYSSGTITVEDAILDAGLANVEVNGDWFLIRGGYSAGGENITAVRLYTLSAGPPLLEVSSFNTDLPNPANWIKEILTNAVWGASKQVAQTVDAASFTAAATALDTAGLGSAIAGALAYDKRQRRFGDLLNELLMLRGMRLAKNAADDWELTVDSAASAATKTFGLADGYWNNVIRVDRNARLPLGQAVRNVVFNYSPLGRTRDKGAVWQSVEYARTATVAASGIGSDLIIQNPWIRSQTVAGRVAYYLGKILGGADNRTRIVVTPEARDVALGERINLKLPLDGVDSEKKVVAVSKSLDSVTLELVDYVAAAFTYNAGDVTFTEAPPDTTERTPPGNGPNLVEDANFSSPLVTVSHSGGTGPLPSKWLLATSADVSFVDHDESDAVRQQTISGHYVSITIVGDKSPTTALRGLLPNQQWPFVAGTLYWVAFYCEPEDGNTGPFVYILWPEFGTVSRVSLVRDSTDTNSAGWARYYGRFRVPAGESNGQLGIVFTKGQTYTVEAVSVLRAGRETRPPAWRIDKAPPVTVLRNVQVALSGASATAALFEEGDSVQGVTARVVVAITTSPSDATYSIGTATDPTAWGTGLSAKALSALISNQGFPIHYATDTNVLVTCDGGTFSSGTLVIQAEATRPPHPAGA